MEKRYDEAEGKGRKKGFSRPATSSHHERGKRKVVTPERIARLKMAKDRAPKPNTNKLIGYKKT